MTLAQVKTKLKTVRNKISDLQARGMTLREDRDSNYRGQWKSMPESKVEEARQIVTDLETWKERESKLIKKQKQLEDADPDTDLELSALDSLGSVKVVKDHADKIKEDPKKGFKNKTEFLQTVMSLDSGRLDPNSKNFDPRCQFLYSNANDTPESIKRGKPFLAVGTDEHATYDASYGGLFLPEGLAEGLISMTAETDFMAPFTAKPFQGGGPYRFKVNARVDKDHTNSVSGGLRVYRREEADDVASSRMKFEQIEFEARPLMGVSYATEELLAASPMAFVGMIAEGFEAEFTNKIINERLYGGGVGEFLGIDNASNVRIDVNRSDASEITGTDVLEMRRKLWVAGSQRPIWVASPSSLTELYTLHIESDNNAGVIKLFNPQDLSAPMSVGSILGYPVFLTEHAKALGTAGDLWLLNLSQYADFIWSGMQSAESMHVRFLNHERTFKFTMMNDARPLWDAKFTGQEDQFERSPFVKLIGTA